MKRLPCLLTATLGLVAAVPTVPANPGGAGGPSPACASPSAAFRPDLPGAYRVGHHSASATDQRRQRTLRYDVWYPVNPAQTGGTTTLYDADEYFFTGSAIPVPSTLAKDGAPASSAGPFPLVVYSHSLGGTRWEAFDLCELMASHGYVVISADHADSGMSGESGDLTDETGPWGKLRYRGPDCSFLIDTALARNSRHGDALRGRINPRRIGGFGYSLGGFSMLAVGGGHASYCGDSRLDAMVLLSGSADFVTPATLEKIRVPAIFLTGTEDGIISQTDAYVRVSGPRLLVNLQDANHDSFLPWHLTYESMAASGQPQELLDLFGAVSPEILSAKREFRRLTAIYTVAGFEHHLMRNDAAARWLSKGYAQAHEPNVAALRTGVSPDLNGNDIVDRRDIAAGTSRDQNHNGIPDEVDGPILRVTPSGAGNRSGNSWANAMSDLPRAVELSAASHGRVREIWVAAGSYAPAPADGNRRSVFLVRNLQLYGGFAGHETRREQRDQAAHLTVLTGDLNGDDAPGFANRFENSFRLVLTLTSNTLTTVDGFTISGAYADDTDFYGGAVQLAFTGLLRNCHLTDNAATYGGAMSAYYGNVTAQDCVFTNNAAFYGGAVAVDDGTLNMIGCRLEGNFAIGYPGNPGLGGAIYEYSHATLNMQNCVLAGNQSIVGGAITVDSYGAPCTLTAVNCLITGNSAVDQDTQPGAGGAIYVAADQSVSFTNLTAAENTSPLSAWYVAGNLTLQNSIVRDGPDWLTGPAVIDNSNITGGYPGTGNQDADPRFRAAAAGDFRLGSRSPCINAGLNSLLPSDVFDLDGDGNVSEMLPWDLASQSRVSGPRVDMGAYEWRRGE